MAGNNRAVVAEALKCASIAQAMKVHDEHSWDGTFIKQYATATMPRWVCFEGGRLRCDVVIDDITVAFYCAGFLGSDVHPADGPDLRGYDRYGWYTEEFDRVYVACIESDKLTPVGGGEALKLSRDAVYSLAEAEGYRYELARHCITNAALAVRHAPPKSAPAPAPAIDPETLTDRLAEVMRALEAGKRTPAIAAELRRLADAVDRS